MIRLDLLCAVISPGRCLFPVKHLDGAASILARVPVWPCQARLAMGEPRLGLAQLDPCRFGCKASLRFLQGV